MVCRVHVVVVGCGRVGSGLARTLEENGHTVAVVDRRSKAFDRLPADFAGQTVLGVGFDRDRLVAAGLERATALAAVTNGDNSNILVARVARETFGIERVVARIYDPRRAKIYERLGIPTIATVEWATERIQFGERIYDFQGVSFPLADSAADASAARLLTREAAWMMDKGANPKVVQSLARHSTITLTLDRYAHADEVDLRAALKKGG